MAARSRSKKPPTTSSPPVEEAPPAAPAVQRTVPAPYTVVARRYRPQRFEDVVGQDHVVRALRNAIRLNRLAQAYLFCGTRGVGKTSIAPDFRQVPQLRERADGRALPDLRHLRVGRPRAGHRRHRDRRGQQQRRRASARAASKRVFAAQPGPLQDLLHRRSAHALHRRVQRPVENARRASAAREILVCDDRAQQDTNHGAIAVSARTISPASRPTRSRRPWGKSAPGNTSRPSPKRSRSSRAAPAARCGTPSRFWTGCWPPVARS